MKFMDVGPMGDQISSIAELLKSKDKISVLTHNTADGDTLGSGIAISIALNSLGKDVSLIYEEDFPDNLSVLRTDHDFYVYLPDNEARVMDCRWDAVAVIDTADPKLLGKREQILGKTDCVVNIDHHISNNGYGNHNLIDVSVSATAEIAYHLIMELGVPLDSDMALSIYTGICTDTGGFSYSNTTGMCHKIAARTLDFGIDVAGLRYKFFDAITLGKLHCHGYVANTLTIHDDGKYAIAVVSAATLAEFGATEEDCEGLVNIGRNVTGVEASLFAREVRPGEFRINLRSRGNIDVSKIARKFNGGGHKTAAGCILAAEPHEVRSILLNALRNTSDCND